MPTESDIISRYFNIPGLAAKAGRKGNVATGIGDDCAVLNIPEGQQLTVSMDVLVEGRHFPVGAPADLVAQRALAVNLSDLAAMGAQPLCFTLGLTMPEADEDWLQGFSDGLLSAAQQYSCPLVGGDLTRGPLQIAVQVQGLVPVRKAKLRSKARPGHEVWVSGSPGRAGLALEFLQGECPELSDDQQAELLQAFYQPEPRLALGQALRKFAGAVMDVSDGLLLDLERMAESSKVNIAVDIAALPLSNILTSVRESTDVFRLILTAGDDYELVFTAAPGRHDAVKKAAAKAGVRVSRIGVVSKGQGLDVVDLSGRPIAISDIGYDHFSD